MTETERVEQEWIRSIIFEAERDLVFLWYITGARLGGQKYGREELPAVLTRVTGALIGSGCRVGLGDPDGDDWQPATDLLEAENPGAAIAAKWLTTPHDVEFLVFARRRDQ